MNYSSQYDRMTRESIPKLILTLSVPTILSMLVTNIYNLVDTAFVGQLGTSQSGAVGVIFGYMAIIQAVGSLFRIAAASQPGCWAPAILKRLPGSLPQASCVPSPSGSS